MKQEEFYTLLIKNDIYSQIDANLTKVYKNDVVINHAGINKKFKIETDGMTKEDIIIALLAKQTLYIKTIKNIIVGVITIAIIGFFLTQIMLMIMPMI